MKKSELKTGMRVMLKDRTIYLVVKDVPTKFYGVQEVGLVHKSGFTCGDNYNEDLTHKHDKNEDVVEVFTTSEDPNALLNGSMLNLDIKYSIWKRDETPKKTIMSEYLEKYPNAKLVENRYPCGCPTNLGYYGNCSWTCEECWKQELKEVK